ncbi:MAG TPA: hypothetical protein VG247_10105 [Pseudonocardiaceae bacterium]|nr:hypothetical protein [Pseudonocardiaceae bacterium]
MTRSEPDSSPAPQAGLPPIHESLLPKEHALYRPRHGGRQRTALTCALVFLLVPALAFVFGVRPTAFENHRLADFPSPSLGWGFFTGLNSWATDHLPLRNAGVQAENGISNGVFGEPPAFSGIDRQAPAGGITAPTAGPPPSSTVGQDSAQVVAGTDGWLYYAQDMLSKCTPTQPLSTTVNELVSLRSAIEASGRSLVLVVAPDKSTVVPQYLPADYPNKDCANAAANPFWSAVTSSGGAIDLRAGLEALGVANRQPVYYPQDTHWADLGSIYMLQAVADAISPGTSRGWRTSRAAVLSGPADLARMNGATANNSDQTYHLSPDGHGDRTGRSVQSLATPTHFGTPATAGMITTPVALLGDSFTLATTRYLPAVFTDLTAIDYGNLVGAPAPVIQTMVGAKTIVLEVVERNLADGNVPFLDPQVIASIQAALASHPMR